MAEKKTKQETPESIDAYTEELQQREQVTGEQMVATAAETQEVYEHAETASAKSLPPSFERFTDEARKIAAAAYDAAIERGASEQDAETDAVIAMKNWAQITGKAYK